MYNQILETKKYTIYIDSCITFEKKSNGESFSLYGEMHFCPLTCRLMKIIPDDYDGCFDFDKKEVSDILSFFDIKIDYSQL
jgi:hypothetical protein